MNSPIILKTAPELKRLVLSAFPDYRKTKCWLVPFHPVQINSYWDGGSRDEFALIDLQTGRTHNLPTASHPYFAVIRSGVPATETETVSVDRAGNVTLKVLPENFALIQAGTSCGKPATARIYVNAANLTKLLGQQA